jgi:hypothetical protein
VVRKRQKLAVIRTHKGGGKLGIRNVRRDCEMTMTDRRMKNVFVRETRDDAKKM